MATKETTETEFMRAERDASVRFMNKHANEDFMLPPGAVAYSREYRCDCGFRTHDSAVIYRHVCPATPDARKDGGGR